jgi:ABC-2 type transport system permease protein
MLEARKIPWINTIGLITLIQREIRRFLNVYMQTVVAPLVTLFLYFIVFSIALGGGAEGRQILGVQYMHFLAPGLLMMTMAQNAFSNSSSSLIIAKVQGNIVDLLMPPLASWEILVGLIVGAVFRGMLIGIIGALILSLFVGVPVHNIGTIILFALMGNIMMASLGIVGGLWAEKFDHLATIANFVITPMTFLAGTFYALTALPPVWQKIALFNPFFYMIDGFRSGFIGVAEAPLLFGTLLMACFSVVLVAIAAILLKTGYKIKS